MIALKKIADFILLDNPSPVSQTVLLARFTADLGPVQLLGLSLLQSEHGFMRLRAPNIKFDAGRSTTRFSDNALRLEILQAAYERYKYAGGKHRPRIPATLLEATKGSTDD